jgi:YfiH family protein
VRNLLFLFAYGGRISVMNKLNYLFKLKEGYKEENFINIFEHMGFQSENIKWGLSEKADGAMNIRLPILDKQCLQNRSKYFDKLGININNVVSTNLIHGTNIVVVDEKDKGKIILNTDGLITAKQNIFLTVTVADCAPIYFFDEKKNIVGLAHAGWRGIVKNISKSLIEKMTSEFGSNPTDISVHIGPHLQKCHFEIKDDIVSEFDNDFILKEDGVIKVDLLSMLKQQLLSLGVKSENISSSDECTYCNRDKYFSYRRDKPNKVQSMIAYIGMTQ